MIASSFGRDRADAITNARVGAAKRGQGPNSGAKLLFQRAVRAHRIDRRGEMLGELAQQLIDGNAERGRELADTLVAEGGAELIYRDRKVRAIAEPRGHLRSEAGFLQLLQQPADAAEIGITENLPQHIRKPGSLARLPRHALQYTVDEIAEYAGHDCLLQSTDRCHGYRSSMTDWLRYIIYPPAMPRARRPFPSGPAAR